MDTPTPIRESVNENLMIFEELCFRAMGTQDSKDCTQTLMILIDTIKHLQSVHDKLDKTFDEFYESNDPSYNIVL